jgi:hypothetical protein
MHPAITKWPTSMENNPTDNPTPPTEKSEPLYAAFVQIRNAELAAHWMRYNTQFAINFGLLAVVVMKAKDSFVSAHLHCITIIGSELALIWLLQAVQSKKSMNKWEKHLQIYEDTIARPEHRLFQKVAAEESKKSRFLRNWQNLRLFALALPSLCLIAWVLVFLSNSNLLSR